MREDTIKELLDLIYAETFNLAEHISYLKGRCDTIVELCAIPRFTNPKRNTKQYKDLYKLEESLLRIINQLNDFAEKTPKDLIANINAYDKNSGTKNKYISTMRGIC